MAHPSQKTFVYATGTLMKVAILIGLLIGSTATLNSEIMGLYFRVYSLVPRSSILIRFYLRICSCN